MIDLGIIILCTVPPLYALSWGMEQYGYFLRYSGVKFQNSGLGYSLHSQIATTTRFASLLAGTLIAIAIETNKVRVIDLSQLTLIILTLIIVLPVISTTFNSYLQHIASKYYLLWNRKQNVKKIPLFKIQSKVRSSVPRGFLSYFIYNLKLAFSRQFFLYALCVYLSFALILLGFFGAYILAETFMQFRLTSFSVAPMLTSIGTLFSIYTIDPKLSSFSDNNNYFKLISVGFISRALSSITVLLLLTLSK